MAGASGIIGEEKTKRPRDLQENAMKPEKGELEQDTEKEECVQLRGINKELRTI